MVLTPVFEPLRTSTTGSAIRRGIAAIGPRGDAAADGPPKSRAWDPSKLLLAKV